MNLQSRVICILLFFTIACGLSAQTTTTFGDLKFEMPDTNLSHANALPEPSTMFDSYLRDLLSTELSGSKNAFILIPENGCAFCTNGMIKFYSEKVKAHPNLQIIIAGNTHQETSGPVIATAILDQNNVCKKYGFDDGFPIVALVAEGKTRQLIHIDSHTIEQQIQTISQFLE